MGQPESGASLRSPKRPLCGLGQDECSVKWPKGGESYSLKYFFEDSGERFSKWKYPDGSFKSETGSNDSGDAEGQAGTSLSVMFPLPPTGHRQGRGWFRRHLFWLVSSDKYPGDKDTEDHSPILPGGTGGSFRNVPVSYSCFIILIYYPHPSLPPSTWLLSRCAVMPWNLLLLLTAGDAHVCPLSPGTAPNSYAALMLQLLQVLINFAHCGFWTPHSCWGLAVWG